MAGSGNIQNRHLNRDRQLTPFHGPASTISGTDPVEIEIENVARDIILENVGNSVNLFFTFVDPIIHGVNNFWKRLKPGQVFSSYCNFRRFWLKGDGASYEVVYNAEGELSFGHVGFSQGNGEVLVVGSPLTIGKMEIETIVAANIEQSHTFPPGTREFMIKARGVGRLLISHDSGTSGTTGMTLDPGIAYKSPEFSAAPAKIIYFQSPIAGLVVEFESWS